MNLYCKCGNKIERKEKGEILKHRGEDICSECRREAGEPRYSKYLSARRSKQCRPA
jgi:hypothetical protein